MTTVLSLGRIQGVPIEFLAEYGGYCKRPERKGCWGWRHRGQFGTQRWPYIIGAWDGAAHHLTLFTETFEPEEDQLYRDQSSMAQTGDSYPLFPHIVVGLGPQVSDSEIERSLWEEEVLNPDLGRTGEDFARGRWAEYPPASGAAPAVMPWLRHSRWGAELRIRTITTPLEEEEP